MNIFKKITVIFFFILIISVTITLTDNNYSYISLPESHLPYYFNRFPLVAEACKADNNRCEYKDWLTSESYSPDACWGYEPNCKMENAFTTPKCPGEHLGWVKDKAAQLNTFYTQADFGKITLLSDFFLSFNIKKISF